MTIPTEPRFRSGKSPLAGRLLSTPLVRGLAVGLVATGATVLLRMTLDRWLGFQEPLLWFIAPVMLAAWTGGRRAGIATTLLAGWIGTLLFIYPRGRFPVTDPGSMFWFGTFVSIGAMISVICGSMRDALAQSRGSLRAAQESAAALEREMEARRQSESYWMQMVRLNLIATGVCGVDGTFHDANDALLELLGYTREELDAGMVRGSDVTPPDYRSLDQNAVGECRETGVCRPYEKEYVARDGTRVPVLMRLAMAPASDDRVVLYAVNMARQKKVERELRANENRLRLILDTVADHAIYSVDAAGTITSWNSGAERVTGYTSEEAVGSPVAMLYPSDGDGSEQVAAHLEAARVGGRAEDEGWRVRRDGTRFWANVVTAPLHEADGAATGFVKITRDLTERRRAGVLMQSLLDNVADGILLLDEWGVIVSFSQGAQRMFGYTEAEMKGKTMEVLLAGDDRVAYTESLREYLETGTTGPLGVPRGVSAARSDGRAFPAELVAGEFYLDGRRHFTCIVRDVTDRDKLEAQLRQSQKMEAVGRLAGGVAHDFNNLLTVINGYSELLLLEMTRPSEAAEMVLSIGEAGEQAAGLTRQLLAFSRRAVLEPRVLDLNDVVRDTERMLGRVIGEDVILTTVLAPDLWHVRVDAGQTAQVLMNLAINARDAMALGGSLTLQTSNTVLDTRLAGRKVDVPEGRYVLLTVHDTGQGMTAEVQAHLFEPFFTTKAPGEGTGLGLATVYGIVRQSGGHIDVYSETGVGTTFKIYLPAIFDEAVQARVAADTAPSGGTETILLVEDEDRVREVARTALTSYGYTVLAVSGGQAALDMLADPAPHVDLVVTDVIMPGLSGPEMAQRAAELRPGLRSLFVSGYTDDTVVRHGILTAEMEFLQKPYTPRSLARKVREVLDQRIRATPR